MHRGEGHSFCRRHKLGKHMPQIRDQKRWFGEGQASEHLQSASASVPLQGCWEQKRKILQWREGQWRRKSTKVLSIEAVTQEMKSQKMLVKPREMQKTQKGSPDGCRQWDWRRAGRCGAEGKDRKYRQRREGRLCRLRANIITGDCCRPNKGKFSPTARKTWGERLKNERAKKWIARVRTDTSLGESSRKTQGRSWRTVGGISRGCSWGGWSGS